MPVKLADVEEEYKKNPKLRKEDVISLKEWADKQPHLPKLTEFEIILFLQSCRFSNEQAKTALDNCLTMRSACPDLFLNRNPKDPELKKTIDMTCITTLPQKTPAGYTVLYAKLINTNPELYVFPMQVKLFDMILSSSLNNDGTMKGAMVILDMEGGQLGHLARVNISHLKKALYYVQEAVPIRLVGVHYINVVPFMDKVMMLLRPFMKKELQELLHIHSKMDTLFEFVPKDILPKECGGNAGTTLELQERMKKMLDNSIEVFKREDTLFVDETKRPKESQSKALECGVSGTFKKIEID